MLTGSRLRLFGDAALLLTLAHLTTAYVFAVWVIHHYDDAGETRLHWLSDAPRRRRAPPTPRGSDVVAARRNQFRNAIRARSRVILIAAANTLWVHAVLTTRRPMTLSELEAAWTPARRRLNRLTRRGAYLAVPHVNAATRSHIHLLLPRRIPHRSLQRIWPAGIVRIYAIHSKDRTRREVARILSRYVTRWWLTFADQWPLNARRYWASRRHAPRYATTTVASLTEARRLMTDVMGSRPTETWSSEYVPDWSGPPTHVWRWR